VTEDTELFTLLERLLLVLGVLEIGGRVDALEDEIDAGDEELTARELLREDTTDMTELAGGELLARTLDEPMGRGSGLGAVGSSSSPPLPQACKRAAAKSRALNR
jgi:hypothetical protein